jgi:hypothetical protein
MNYLHDDVYDLRANQKFCNYVLLPIFDKVFGFTVHSRLRELLEFQWKSEEEIDDYRINKLNYLIRLCNNRFHFMNSFKNIKLR